MGLIFLIFFLWAFWPQWCLGLGPNMPIAKGQPQVVQVSLGPWAHCQGSATGGADFMGPSWCPRSHDPQKPFAIGVGQWVWVFCLSRCGGALVDGFDFPAIFLWACWPQWCLALGPNMPIAKGQPQVVQISWGPIGCTRSHDPTANCHWCLASGCGFFFEQVWWCLG